MASMPISIGGSNTMFGNSSAPGTFQFAPTGNQPGMSSGMPTPMSPMTTNPTGAQGGSTTAQGMPKIQGQQIPGGMAHNPSTAMTAPGAGTLGTLQQTNGTPGTSATNTQMPGMTSTQDQRFLGEQQNYYGEGLGAYITSLIQNGGMNPNLVNATDVNMIDGMQGQINSGANDLTSRLGAMGVSGNSSETAGALSAYENQATSQENSVISQNYMQQYDIGQQMLQSILGNVMNVNAQGTANQPTIMDDIGSVLSLGTAGAKTFSSLASIIPGLG